MKLSVLLMLAGIECKAQDGEVTLITDDSRRCAEGSVFVCRSGDVKHAEDALNNKAMLVVAESRLCENCAVVPDAGKAYAALCREFFSRPDEEMKMLAVTGTNGKTSVSTILHFLLSMNGRPTGLIGTVVNMLDTVQPAELTTPDCFTLYSMLRRAADSGKKYCVVEASSQGLAEQRLYGIEFEIAVFTNLTEDHLDVHKTFENYKNAKLSLFSHCKTAIINFDDPYREEFKRVCKGKIITYSLKSDESDFTAKNIICKSDSTSYVLVANNLIHTFRLPVRGDIWVSNSMASVIAALHLGLSLDECSGVLRSFSGVKGRMEPVQTQANFEVIIDYAHTADGLRRVISSLKRQCKGRVIAVFGCGGDREKQKRSEMGKAVCVTADIAVVTTDNPRTEDAGAIIDDILAGTKGSRIPVYIKKDRREAICFALEIAKENDVVLLAGKGHENYQINGKEKIPFDERQIVRDFFAGGC